MNQVALNYSGKKPTIEIYFIKTDKHKEIELYLLNKIDTHYNVKNKKLLFAREGYTFQDLSELFAFPQLR